MYMLYKIAIDYEVECLPVIVIGVFIPFVKYIQYYKIYKKCRGIDKKQ